MIIIMKQGTTHEHVGGTVPAYRALNVKANLIYGEDIIVIGLVGDTGAVDKDALMLDPQVENIIKVQELFAGKPGKFHPDNSVAEIAPGVVVGGKKLVVMARARLRARSRSSTLLPLPRRTGNRSPRRRGSRSSPYLPGSEGRGSGAAAQGAVEATGLPVVTEITNPAHIDIFMDKCDCFQVGARNMQNFELLKELGQTRKPILLKRGFANTMEEFLMSAESIMAGGNENVILCERGIRTYEKYTRNTLDISAVPVLKRMSHLPVIVDTSHAGGIYWMVEPLAKAAVAAGADGLMIEVHNDPAHALSDGAQSLTYDSFHHTMNALRAVAAAVDQEI